MGRLNIKFYDITRDKGKLIRFSKFWLTNQDD